MSDRAFLGTNVLIYALALGDPKAAVAERLLLAGGRISVQVLNEFASVATRKLAMPWPDLRAALVEVRRLCGDPVTLDESLHVAALDLAEQHGLNVYDALIVAAARSARCDVLYTEDMQHGRRFEGGPRIENPFLP
jgi:predicted nucleic acid-binding protein